MNGSWHVTGDLPAYALDALEPGDRLRVETHLEICELCRREWEAYRETAGILAFAVPLRIPDPALKAKILAQTRETAGVSAPARKDFWDMFTGKRLQLLLGWSIASFLLMIVLGVSSILLWGRTADLQNQSGEMNFHTVALSGTEYAPSASALIVVPRDDVVGTLVLDNMPQLDAGQEYQLWLIRDGERTSAAVFSVDEDGYDTVYLHLPALLDTYDSFGVTIEPVGGSDTPTGERVLQGTR